MGSSLSSSMLLSRRTKELSKAQRLYQSGDVDGAIKVWTRISNERRVSDSDKLTTFGWLAIACFTTGHFREMATWSARQLRLARQIFREPSPGTDGTSLIEALLNVARSELGQGNLARAAFFAAEALIAVGENMDANLAAASTHSQELTANSLSACEGNLADCRRLSGYCHLVAAHACLGEGSISSGLEHLDKSLMVARQCYDQLLELFVQMALASLFISLKDYNRALHYCGRCETLARSLQPSQSPDVTSCRRSISLYYANIMRKVGRPDYAETIVQELLGDQNCTKDPSFQASCFLLLGDLARKEGQTLRAYNLYENAYSLMRQSGSRFGELTVLLQLAKCLLRMRDTGTVCECKAIEVVQRCCLFARSSNANLIRIRSLRFLERVLTSLGDTKAASVTSDELSRLRATIGLVCAVCQQPVGDHQSAVSILPCAHLAHDQCLVSMQTESQQRPVSATNSLRRSQKHAEGGCCSSDSPDSNRLRPSSSCHNVSTSNKAQHTHLPDDRRPNDDKPATAPLLRCFHCSAAEAQLTSSSFFLNEQQRNQTYQTQYANTTPITAAGQQHTAIKSCMAGSSGASKKRSSDHQHPVQFQQVIATSANSTVTAEVEPSSQNF